MPSDGRNYMNEYTHVLVDGELQPCPFCGGGETRLDVSSHWTGMRSEIVAYALRHHCVKGDGVLNCYLEFRGKTRTAVVAQWNARAAPVVDKTETDILDALLSGDWNTVHRIVNSTCTLDGECGVDHFTCNGYPKGGLPDVRKPV